MQKYWIYLNSESKKWYATTTTNSQAIDFSKFMMKEYGISCTITSGSNHYKSGKPAFYIVELEKNPYETKENN